MEAAWPPVRGAPQLCDPQGYLQGLAAPRGTQEGTHSQRQLDKEETACSFPRPPVLPLHSQDSTLFLIFSLILVQQLGEAGEES